MNVIRTLLAAATGIALASSASAQTATKSTRVIKETHTVNDGAPQHGANSFTEAQARGHIQNAGFTRVSALTKGNDGIWRGTAHKGGRTLKVALDYKGNVTTNR
jgi:putative membrane protein